MVFLLYALLPALLTPRIWCLIQGSAHRDSCKAGVRTLVIHTAEIFLENSTGRHQSNGSWVVKQGIVIKLLPQLVASVWISYSPSYTILVSCHSFFKKVFLIVYLFIVRERESGHEWGRGREREGERERIPSRLYFVSVEPDVGLELTTMRSWPELKSDTSDWATQVFPVILFFFNCNKINRLPNTLCPFIYIHILKGNPGAVYTPQK